MDVQHDVGVLKPYARTHALAQPVLEIVDDGVLDPVGHIARMGKLVAVDGDIDREGLLGSENLVPFLSLDAVVELIGV